MQNVSYCDNPKLRVKQPKPPKVPPQLMERPVPSGPRYRYFLTPPTTVIVPAGDLAAAIPETHRSGGFDRERPIEVPCEAFLQGAIPAISLSVLSRLIPECFSDAHFPEVRVALPVQRLALAYHLVPSKEALPEPKSVPALSAEEPVLERLEDDHEPLIVEKPKPTENPMKEPDPGKMEEVSTPALARVEVVEPVIAPKPVAMAKPDEVPKPAAQVEPAATPRKAKTQLIQKPKQAADARPPASAEPTEEKPAPLASSGRGLFSFLPAFRRRPPNPEDIPVREEIPVPPPRARVQIPKPRIARVSQVSPAPEPSVPEESLETEAPNPISFPPVSHEQTFSMEVAEESLEPPVAMPAPQEEIPEPPEEVATPLAKIPEPPEEMAAPPEESRQPSEEIPELSEEIPASSEEIWEPEDQPTLVPTDASEPISPPEVEAEVEAVWIESEHEAPPSNRAQAEIPHQDGLQAVFMTEELIGIDQVVQYCGTLPGVHSCVLSHGAAVLAAYHVPDHVDLVSLSAHAVEMLASMRTSVAKMGIGAVPAVTVHSESGPITFFNQDDLCLLILHKDRGFVPGVRERLQQVIEELSRANLPLPLPDGESRTSST